MADKNYPTWKEVEKRLGIFWDILGRKLSKGENKKDKTGKCS